VPVYAKPRVGIIPTGSEIVEEISQVKEGTIIDSNSHGFQGLGRKPWRSWKEILSNGG